MDFNIAKAKKFIEAASVEIDQKTAADDVSWNVRLPAEVLVKAKKIAKSEGRSLNSQLAVWIKRGVNNYSEE